MDSCMRAYSTVQQLLCHGGYCELILSLARTLCRLLFTTRPTARPLADNPLRDVRSRNPSKSMLAHDAVGTTVLHKHHQIIRVGAGLIQFVYRLHLRLATEVTRNRNEFSPFCARVGITTSSKICGWSSFEHNFEYTHTHTHTHIHTHIHTHTRTHMYIHTHTHVYITNLIISSRGRALERICLYTYPHTHA